MATGDLVKLGTLFVAGTKRKRPLNPTRDGDILGYSAGQPVEIRDTDSDDAFKLQFREVSVGAKKLLICDRNILRNITHDELKNLGFVTGKKVTIDGQEYLMRLLTGGPLSRVGGSNGTGEGGQLPNEWDDIIGNEGKYAGLPTPTAQDLSGRHSSGAHNQFWNWGNIHSWCQETVTSQGVYRTVRGNSSARTWQRDNATARDSYLGWRPILEVLNSAPLITGGSQNLGNKTGPFSVVYQVSDPEGHTVNVTEKINGKIVRTQTGVPQKQNLELVVTLDQWASVPLNQQSTIEIEAIDEKGAKSTRLYTFTKTNVLPLVILSEPVTQNTLYEKDTLLIKGTVTDVDKGDTVTVRYQINSGTPRAITAYLSDGTKKEFGKTLTFKAGALYDGDTLVADALKDGEAHLLKVWATDDQGGQSVIVERDFYVVPNRAPRLEVTPPVIDGVIDSDTFTIAGTYADADKNETVISYRINGSASKEVVRGTSGTFDFTLSLSQLTVGQNTIVVDALDSYGAKTSRTIKLNKNTIATPLLQSTVRYLIQPPKGSAQAVLLWLQRDQELAVTASLHMGMKGEAEAFTLLEPTNTAPLRDNAAILEDEFYHEADSAKDHIILQLDMKRSSVESTAAIHLISGVFE